MALVRAIITPSPSLTSLLKPADSMPKLRLDISNTAPGAEVNFAIIRSGKERNLKVTLGDLSDAGELAMRSGGPPTPPVEEKKEFLKDVEIGEKYQGSAKPARVSRYLGIGGKKDAN